MLGYERDIVCRFSDVRVMKYLRNRHDGDVRRGDENGFWDGTELIEE